MGRVEAPVEADLQERRRPRPPPETRGRPRRDRARPASRGRPACPPSRPRTSRSTCVSVLEQIATASTSGCSMSSSLVANAGTPSCPPPPRPPPHRRRARRRARAPGTAPASSSTRASRRCGRRRRRRRESGRVTSPADPLAALALDESVARRSDLRPRCDLGHAHLPERPARRPFVRRGPGSPAPSSEPPAAPARTRPRARRSPPPPPPGSRAPGRARPSRPVRSRRRTSSSMLLYAAPPWPTCRRWMTAYPPLSQRITISLSPASVAL